MNWKLEADDEVVLVDVEEIDPAEGRRAAEERYEDDAESHSARWMRDHYGEG